MTKYIILLLLSIASLTYARVLYVPDSLGTIQAAVQSSLPGDTILLGRGIYIDTVSVTHALTIGSNNMFSGDSSTIWGTSWNVQFSRPAINLLNAPLHIIGIRFLALGAAQTDRTVIISSGSTLKFTNCRFDGSFATGSTVQSTNGGGVTLIGCGVTNDRNSNCLVRVVSPTRLLEVRNSWFLSVGARLNPTSLFWGTADSVLIIANNFNGRSHLLNLGIIRYFEVSDNVFEGFDNGALRLIGGGIQRQSKFVRNTLCNATITTTNDNILAIPCPSPPNFSHLVENCVFENIVQLNTVGVSQLILSNTTTALNFRKCDFRDNVITSGNVLELSPNQVIDSCRFIGNSFWTLLNQPPPIRAIYFRDCDFINNFGTLRFGSVDTVWAPNCYWGSTTGPTSIRNPGGTGQAVANEVFPLPFRTTPVFPDTRAPEESPRSEQIPTNSILLACYPNPANPDVTIRATLPYAIRDVEVTIVNLTGQTVATLHHGPLAGQREWHWQPVSASSGVYFARVTPLHSNLTPTSQKFVVLK